MVEFKLTNFERSRNEIDYFFTCIQSFLNLIKIDIKTNKIRCIVKYSVNFGLNALWDVNAFFQRSSPSKLLGLLIICDYTFTYSLNEVIVTS